MTVTSIALPLQSSDEECVKLRAKILAPLRQLHKDTEKQVSLRWNFEEGVRNQPNVFLKHCASVCWYCSCAVSMKHSEQNYRIIVP